MAAYLRLYHSGGGSVVSSIVSFFQKTECIQINRVFLPVKLIFFFSNAGASCLFPYMPVFMTDLGLSTFQTGIARGAEPLLHLLVGPMWAAISDRFSRHKTLLITSLIIPALLYFSTQFVPAVPVPWVQLNDSVTMATPKKPPDVRWQQMDSQQVLPNLVKWSLSTPKSPNTSTYSTPTPHSTAAPKSQPDSTFTFLLMILLVGGARLFLSPFTPIFDSTVVRMTKEHQGDYGRQRMFGAIGFGLFSPIAGAAIDAFAKHFPQWNKYIPAFYLHIGMVPLILLPITILKFPAHRRTRAIYRNVGALFCQIEFLAFLLAAFTCGFSLGALNTFLFIFIDELNGPHILMGLNITICALSSAACMFFSAKAIQKLGHKNVFKLVLFCHVLRHILYSFLYNPWLTAPVGLLHGVCFGMFWPTCTSYVNIIAPTGMEASVQSVAHSIYFGLGRGLGMIVGGAVFHKFGSRNMFRFFAVFCCVVILILWLVHCYTAWARRRRLTLLQGPALSVQYEEI